MLEQQDKIDNAPVREWTNVSENEAKAVEAISKAENEIRKRVMMELGDNHNPPLFYHTLEHSVYTQQRALAFYDDVCNKIPWVILRIPQDEYNADLSKYQSSLRVRRQLLSAMALGHDLVQNGVIDEEGDYQRKRGVSAGENEYESAIQIIAELKKAGGDDIFGLLSEFGISEQQIISDLEATFVTFTPNEKIKRKTERGSSATRIQQSYFTNASFEGQSMALADLYGAYSSKDIVLTFELSIAEFREKYQWILTLAEQLKQGSTQDIDQNSVDRALYLMKLWFREQGAFLILNSEELEKNNNSMKQSVTSILDRTSLGRLLKKHFDIDNMRGNGRSLAAHYRSEWDRAQITNIEINRKMMSDNMSELRSYLKYFGYDVLS